MNKNLNDPEILKRSINIISVDIDKMFISDKFSGGKKGC